MIGRIHKVNYPLVYPFKLSYGTFYEREGLIVELKQKEVSGWGEMSFVPYYGKDVANILQQLRIILKHLESVGPDWTPWDLYRQLDHEFAPDHFLMSAIDCALYDLYGRLNGIPIWQITGGRKEVVVVSSLTLTQDDWEEKLDWNWPVLKLKMGFEGDMDLLRDIRQKYPGALRIDANSGWTLEGFDERVDRLAEWEIELVEQPVPTEVDDQLAGRQFPFPLAADESMQGIEDLERIARIYDVVNIKLQKCGGITPALEIIHRSKDLGLQLMAGCMTESSIGIGAMAHLGSFFHYLDLDGEYLITPIFGSQRFVKEGKVVLGTNGGLGQDFIVK